MEALDLEKEILISHQPDIDKICLHAKNSYDAKYWFLIKKRDGTGLKHLNDSKDLDKDLLNTQMIWIIFKKRLKNTIQIKNVKY